MNIEVPYNFLILSAFTNILKYENKRVLKISNLEKFITEVLNTTKINYYLNKITGDFADWHGEIIFLEDADYLNKFFEKYGQYFQKDGDALKIASPVDYNDTWHLAEQEIKEMQINHRFLEFLEDIEILKILDITSIPNILKKALAMEKEIEKDYLKNTETEETMASYALKRILFLNNLNQCSEDVILCFLNVLVQMNDEDMFFPMDFEEFKNSSYYHGSESDIMDKMCNYFNKAIFNSKDLAQEKLLMMIEDVMSYKWSQALEVEEEEVEEEFPEVLEATALFESDELKFCYAYLEKIEDFIAKYGENHNLETTYKRLLYVLDDPTMELLNPEEVEANRLDVEETELIGEEEPLHDFANEAYYFCEDIFKKDYDINTIKKLLFISSYYEVTKDEQVINILQKNSNHRNFTYYSDLILGEDNDKILKLER